MTKVLATPAPASSEASAPPTAPLSARRERTRSKLMDAAFEVFAERGILGASVEEICEAAGFTRGAFYSNFADKDALVLAMVEQNITEGYDAAERAIGLLKQTSPGLGAAERIERVLSEFEAEGHSDRTSVLVQQELLLYAARVPAISGAFRRFEQTVRVEIRRLVEGALADSGLEFTVPFDTALELLIAAHERSRLTALFTHRADPTLLYTLVMTLTRPV